MITGLQERPLVEDIYITVSYYSKTPMHRRDLKKNMIVNGLSGVTEDAKASNILKYYCAFTTEFLFVDLINDLANGDKVCLVIIDSADLTTSMSDLELFIRYMTYYFLTKTIN